MNTIYEKIDENQINYQIVEKAGNILKNGGLVAIPTETVYGLGADALDEKASAKIYEAKGRPSDNPLIIHISKLSDLDKVACQVSEEARQAARYFWPGPLTMIFAKKDIVPYGTTGGLETVAVRMPEHPVALAVISAGGGFIAAPSANTSGKPSPTKAEHVAEDLNGKIDMILDSGPVGIGLESTIVDMSVPIPTILRPGYITQEMLETCISRVEIDSAFLGHTDGKRPKAPGMKYKHYAPKAPLTIVQGDQDIVIKKINQLCEEKQKNGLAAGIIATDESFPRYQAGMVKSAGSRAQEETIAHNLYRVLREFDEEDIDCIYTEAFSESSIGMAIMNRLLKAAGYRIIYV